MISFKSKQIIIVCHDSMAGPPHHTLRDFVNLHHANRVIFIGHQNRYVQSNPVKGSYLEVYEFGQLKYKVQTETKLIPEPLAYIRDFIRTFIWIRKYSVGKVHYYIGLGNLNALNGLILKCIGKVDRVIYYVIDYMPIRFTNIFMNSIYHYIDYICVRYSTLTWNYAQGMITSRNNKWRTKFPNQIIVPNGVFIHSKALCSDPKIYLNTLVYLGTLYEQQGIRLLVESLPIIKKAIHNVRLIIIGFGPLKKELEEFVQSNSLSSVVEFKGFIENPFHVDRIVSRAAIGIAMYKPNIGFVSYTEPGKVKRYLACGVPVVMTDVSPIAAEIEFAGCGFRSPYDKEIFSTMIIKLLRQRKNLKQLRRKATHFVKEFEWEIVFTKAFQSISD